ncbi:unnamed protein product [Bursaphelenchus okinawaensis]|uniref:Uncharacterized protein n=1 Tax=Bursaphelenchus okinawaensis TaxID=465554 RepID=A0A811K177_9BILA|nr:unnamed protein product [Bursaphelenchus okinawaensis]CAG9089744.1 unnamed protein product [Bursaphelenchus okinawaensis]
MTNFEHGLKIFTTLCVSYSLVKVLAFAEISTQLKYVGIWLNVSSNILISLFLPRLYTCISKQAAQNVNSYQRMGNDDVTIIEHGQHNGITTFNNSNNNGITSSNGQRNPTNGALGTDNNTTDSRSGTNDSTRTSTGDHIRNLLQYCRLHMAWFGVGFVFLIVYSAARVFIPYYVGQVLADIMAEAHQKESNFVNDILMLCVLTVISTVFAGLRGGTFTQATALINRSMRRDLFSSLVKQEIAFFDSNQTGAITSRLTTDCQTVASSVSTNVNVFLRNSVMLIGSLIFMFQLSWKLTMITFIAVPPLMLFSKYYGSYYETLSEKTQNTMADANRMAEEVIGSMRTVRAFACEEQESDRYLSKLNNTLHYNRKKAVAYMGYVWVNELSENVVLIAVLIYAGRLAIKGELDAASATSFLFYQMQLSENFTGLNYVFSGLMESVGASRKVLEYIHREPEIKNDGNFMGNGDVEGCIEVDKVEFAYPSRPNNNVLKELSIKIQPGQTAALVGPSGAGKSSIIALLEHFYNVAAGSIKLDGIPISEYAHRFYHQKVSLVSQEPVLYSGSVRENILYGCEDTVSEEDMVEATKLANAYNFIMEMEHGFDTLCGEKGVQMSGGQKQRIAIARALVRKPAVLILDEATSALDSESEYIIQQALQKCCVGRTVIVIAHRLSTVEKADKIFVVNKGKVVQEGCHLSLMQQEGLYRQLVQRQLLNGAEE